MSRETEDRSDHPVMPVYASARPLNVYDALGIESHFLLVAVRNVLSAHEMQEELGEDERLRTARDDFDARFEHARWLRNALEHADLYAVGQGDHQAEIAPDPRSAHPYFVQVGSSGDVAGFELRFGPLAVPLADVARAAIQLADVTEEVRRDRIRTR